VALTTEFVTLETRSYADFQDFLDRLREVLDALVNIFRPTIGTRVGLRYVNELRPGHEDWSRVVRPELLGPLAVPEVGALVVHADQQFQLRDPDGLAVQLAHGLVPGGSSVQPKLGEEPAQTPFYLLDMDVFQEFPHPGSLLMDPAAICTRVATFHEVVSRLFRWAITPEFAATLGVRDDVA
jgi:uncharacterized protein (TIGR04255 family)